MAKKSKIYVVKEGVNTGIFNTWEECEKNIKGYSNAVYKSFTSMKEAEAYLNGIDSISMHKEQAKKIDGVVAYVDGSYSAEKNKYSFGCVIIGEKGKLETKCGCGDEAIALSINNVAGELQGTMYAIKWAYENKYKNILVKHDYEGISKWINGEWQAKNLAVKKYVEFVKKYIQNNINISFEKVDGHSGDKYNEEADRLARKALENGNNISKGDSWVTINNITKEDVEIILSMMEKDTDINITLKNENSSISNYILKLNDEVAVIKMFIEKSKLLIQGKCKNISSILLTYISEIVELEQMMEISNDLFKISIEKENINKVFEGYFINSKEYLPDKIIKVLHQAVYNLSMDAQFYDSTFLIFPALRGLEGVLKFILENYKICCSTGFNMFKIKDNDTYKLTDEYIANIGSPNKIRYINKMYNFYYKHRHTLFHWNDPASDLDDTRLIESCESARNIIKSTLQLIDEYYNIK